LCYSNFNEFIYICTIKYKRPWNHCDLWGLEEYTKMKKALDELNEIMAKCPCDYEERPPWVVIFYM